MHNTIIPFVFKTQNVRVVVINDVPWWVAKDLCEVLDLEQVRRAISRLDDDDLTTSKVIDSLGREQEVNLVNESGLYSLILTSRKPEAREFKRWLTREVLPSIRQTGTYATGHLPPSASSRMYFLEPEFLAAQRLAIAVGITAPNQAAIAADNCIRNLYGLSPLKMLNAALEAPSAAVQMTPTGLGQELGGMNTRKVNKLLESLGLQARIDRQWQATKTGEPHSVRVDVQKRHNEGAPVTQLKWLTSVIDVLREALNERRAHAT